MEDVQSLFRDHANHFTIYVVEQKFAVGKGFDFFKNYQGKSNYIDTNQMAKTVIMKIHSWIDKKIPSIADLIKISFGEITTVNIVDLVVALTKLFTVQEHQAAGPNVIDPIIVQEGKVLKKYINQLVNLYQNSILMPAIIILLQDNDFDRAKKILSECPNGIYIKFIRNKGKCELYKVVNTGAENIIEFINSFSQQCFSTCSNTPHNILLNKEWAENSKIKEYAPRILKYRSDLLCDEKKEIIPFLCECISELEKDLNTSTSLTSHDIILLKNFLCVAKIYRVFCNDYGGNDIIDALAIANEMDNELLRACVYKYAYFFSNKNIREQDEILEEAYRIFSKNEMADNAIYCKNNRLIRQFDIGKINAKDFSDMVGEATSDVPGLVGMSHIFNNTGIAYLMTAQPDLAMEYFDRGIDYAKTSDRFVQNIALYCNKMIAKSYYNEKIEYSEIERLLIQIFDGMVCNNKLPFISSRYVMNLLMIALRNNPKWCKEILQNYEVIELINQGLRDNSIGSGQLLMQLEYLDQKLPELKLKSQCITTTKIIPVTGKRRDFIQKSGLNPFYFCTWL
ncbi:hypothetical protein [Holdemanella biformis]|jgi:hypothetical protein|uniref:hypothetical protein n=1 Tax=Holdemanella biformis TaxID=1735 RepID=UPI00266C9CCE|nr:hypothetical protein [Holdemanella biformis]